MTNRLINHFHDVQWRFKKLTKISWQFSWQWPAYLKNSMYVYNILNFFNIGTEGTEVKAVYKIYYVLSILTIPYSHFHPGSWRWKWWRQRQQQQLQPPLQRQPRTQSSHRRIPPHHHRRGSAWETFSIWAIIRARWKEALPQEETTTIIIISMTSNITTVVSFQFLLLPKSSVFNSFFEHLFFYHNA